MIAYLDCIFKEVAFFNLPLFFIFLNFLGIIETIIGLLIVAFGVTLLFYPEDHKDYSWSGIVGIIGGPLIFVAGVVGIVSYKDPQNYCKNGLHMAFSILACCVSVVGAGFFSEGVR